MTSVTYHDVQFLEPAKTRNYLNVDYGAFSWLLTKDHKRIGILYMFSISLMFILGGFFAMMMRLELLTPEGDLLTSDTYNKFFTLHGIIMIFFFLIPSIPGGAGELHPADPARREGPRVSEAQSPELVSLHDRGVHRTARDHPRRRRYRLDLLHAVLDAVLEHARARHDASARSSSGSHRS